MWSNGSLCVTVAAPEGRPSVRLFHQRHCKSLPGEAFMCTMRTHAHKMDLDESTLSCRGQCGVSWRLPNREISSPTPNFLWTQLFPVTFFALSPYWYIFDPDTQQICWDEAVCSVYDSKHITAKYLTLITFMLGSNLAFAIITQSILNDSSVISIIIIYIKTSAVLEKKMQLQNYHFLSF